MRSIGDITPTREHYACRVRKMRHVDYCCCFIGVIKNGRTPPLRLLKTGASVISRGRIAATSSSTCCTELSLKTRFFRQFDFAFAEIGNFAAEGH